MSIRRRMAQVRYQQSSAEPDLNKPVPLPLDHSTISPHEREVARFRAEDAKTGGQTDEVPPTVVRRPQRGLRRSGSHAPPSRDDDRAARRMEDYYKQMGYNPSTIEDEAEQTFQIAQRLNKRKRGLRNIKLTGMEN